MSNILTAKLSERFDKKVTNATLLNSIREGASDEYKRDIPELPEFAQVNHNNVPYSNYYAHANEFFDGLFNKVATSTYKALEMSPLSARFKKGTIRTGNTWEEVLVELTDAKQYDAKSSISPFKYKHTDVKSVFHDINREVYYERTFTKDWAEKAMLSDEAFDTFINAMLKSLISSDVIDETQYIKDTMTNMLTPVNIAKVGEPSVNISAVSKEYDMTEQDFVLDFVKELNNRSRLFAFANRSNPQNAIQSPIQTPINEQVLVVDSLISSEIDMLYANIFNMDKADILARKIVIDEFPTYEGEGDLKGAKPFAILMSEDSVVIKDKVLELNSIFNPRTRNYELFYHHQQMITYSLIENAIVYYIMPDENGEYNRVSQQNVKTLNENPTLTTGNDAFSKLLLEKIESLETKLSDLENETESGTKTETKKEPETDTKTETKKETKKVTDK